MALPLRQNIPGTTLTHRVDRMRHSKRREQTHAHSSTILLLMSVLATVCLVACRANDGTPGPHDLVPKPTRIIADEETGTFEVETDGEVEVGKLPDTLSVFTKANGQITEGVFLRPGSKLHSRCYIKVSGHERVRVLLPAAVIWVPTSDLTVANSFTGPWASVVFCVSVDDHVLREFLECHAVLVRPGATVHLHGLGSVMPEWIRAD